MQNTSKYMSLHARCLNLNIECKHGKLPQQNRESCNLYIKSVGIFHVSPYLSVYILNFCLETLGFEWQCSQYLEPNPTVCLSDLTVDYEGPENDCICIRFTYLMSRIQIKVLTTLSFFLSLSSRF